MTHTTSIKSTEEGFVVECSCGEKVPGIYFTMKKAQKAASSHASYNADVSELSKVNEMVDAIAKESKTFGEFQTKVLGNKKLTSLVGRRTLEKLIQHNETAMDLD